MSSLKQITVDNVVYDIEDNATRTVSRVLITDSNGKTSVSPVTTTELNKLDGLTADTAELNKLDGLTADTAELNLLDGKTSDNLHKITAGTIDLTSGVSALATGEIYCVYEA